MAEAWATGNGRAARQHARALLEWLDKNGFPPRITGYRDFDRELVQLAAKQIYG